MYLQFKRWVHWGMLALPIVCYECVFRLMIITLTYLGETSFLFLYMSVYHCNSASESSVTADLRPLSAGPLLVAPSWRAASRLGRGRRRWQLYWCRKGHTRRIGPVSAAARYPPGCHNHNTHICPHVSLQPKHTRTPASADPCQIGCGPSGTYLSGMKLLFTRWPSANRHASLQSFAM